MTRKHNKKAKRAPKIVWDFQALKSERRSKRFREERDQKLSSLTNRACDVEKENADYTGLTPEEKVKALTEIIRDQQKRI